MNVTEAFGSKITVDGRGEVRFNKYQKLIIEEDEGRKVFVEEHRLNVFDL